MFFFVFCIFQFLFVGYQKSFSISISISQVFSCSFFSEKMKNNYPVSSILFRWLPTSYCLTPENPVSSLQVADAVRYVHAQKMVHRATWMITCICLMRFLQQYHGKTPWPHHWGEYVLPFSKHQARKSKIMFFQVFVCHVHFLILFYFPFKHWFAEIVSFFGRRLTFFFAREIWSNPVFCCRNDAISRDVGLRSVFLRRRTEDSIVSAKKSGHSIWFQAYRDSYLQLHDTRLPVALKVIHVWFLKGLLKHVETFGELQYLWIHVNPIHVESQRSMHFFEVFLVHHIDDIKDANVFSVYWIYSFYTRRY